MGRSYTTSYAVAGSLSFILHTTGAAVKLLVEEDATPSLKTVCWEMGKAHGRGVGSGIREARLKLAAAVHRRPENDWHSDGQRQS